MKRGSASMIRVEEEREELEDEEEEEEEEDDTSLVANQEDSAAAVNDQLRQRQASNSMLASRGRFDPRRASSSTISQDGPTFPAKLAAPPTTTERPFKPHFLKNRSATIVDLKSSSHSSGLLSGRSGPLGGEPPSLPQSRASAFLMSVLAKARAANSLDPRYGGGGGGAALAAAHAVRAPTNSLHYTHVGPSDPGRRLRVSSVASRRPGRADGLPLSLQSESTSLDDALPGAEGDGEMETPAELVAAIKRGRQQLPEQLEAVQRVQLALETRGGDVSSISAALVAAGLLAELAATLREFRFHPVLHVCVVHILSAVAATSGVFACMMSELGVEASLRKSVAVHAGHDRLVVLASALLHGLDAAKTPANLQAARDKPAEPTPLAAQIKTVPVVKLKPANSPKPMRAASPAPSPSASRLRQALATPPPALSVHYDLVAVRPNTPALLVVSPQSPLEDCPVPLTNETKKRPSTSPERHASFGSAINVAATYGGPVVFVEPSPLRARLNRGVASAGGVRRRLRQHLRPRADTVRRLEAIPPTHLPPSTREDGENKNVGRTFELTSASDGDAERSATTDEDDEAYEDDFTQDEPQQGTPQNVEPCAEMSRVESDSELMDLLPDAATPELSVDASPEQVIEKDATSSKTPATDRKKKRAATARAAVSCKPVRVRRQTESPSLAPVVVPRRRKSLQNECDSTSTATASADTLLGGPDPLRCLQDLYAEGLRLHKAGELHAAAAKYEAALALSPATGRPFASVHVNLGSARLALGQAHPARESLETARRLQPDSAKAAYNLGLALLLLGRPRDAREQFRDTLRLEPTHERAREALVQAEKGHHLSS